jgi:hypothetical protein
LLFSGVLVSQLALVMSVLDASQDFGAAPATSTGRWTEAEHAAFEEGLRRAGTNWR